jgi:hypothetical protein
MLTNPTLRSQIDAVWNRFWSGGINNPLNAFDQKSYLVFLNAWKTLRSPAVPKIYFE